VLRDKDGEKQKGGLQQCPTKTTLSSRSSVWHQSGDNENSGTVRKKRNKKGKSSVWVGFQKGPKKSAK